MHIRKGGANDRHHGWACQKRIFKVIEVDLGLGERYLWSNFGLRSDVLFVTMRIPANFSRTKKKEKNPGIRTLRNRKNTQETEKETVHGRCFSG